MKSNKKVDWKDTSKRGISLAIDPNDPRHRVCPCCGTEFMAEHKNTTYCCVACRYKHNVEKKRSLIEKATNNNKSSNQIDELDKLTILEQYIDDDAQFRKSVKKLINDHSDKRNQYEIKNAPYKNEVEEAETDDDEYEILSDFVDPFNQADPIVRPYVFQEPIIIEEEPVAEENPKPVKSPSIFDRFQAKTKMRKVSTPTYDRKFQIGETVIFPHNGENKIGKIVGVAWDANYEEYKYYFSDGTKSFSYLKENELLRLPKESPQMLELTGEHISVIPQEPLSFLTAQTMVENAVKAHQRSQETKTISEASKTTSLPRETLKKATPKSKKSKPKKPQIIERDKEEKMVNPYFSGFKDFYDGFDFICESKSRNDLIVIYNGIKNDFGFKTTSKQDKANNKAFFDMVMEQINVSKLFQKDKEGLSKLKLFLQFSRLAPASLGQYKVENHYTVTEYYRINTAATTKKPYYKAEGDPKTISELAFYKKLFLYKYIDIKRWRKLKAGADSISQKEVFQTDKIKLTFKKTTKKVYELKDPTCKELVCALIFKKLEKIKADNKKPSPEIFKKKVGRPVTKVTTLEDFDTDAQARVNKRVSQLEIIENSLKNGLAKYGLKMPHSKEKDFSLSQTYLNINPNDLANFLLDLDLEKKLKARYIDSSTDFYKKLLRSPLKSLKFIIHENLKSK